MFNAAFSIVYDKKLEKFDNMWTYLNYVILTNIDLKKVCRYSTYLFD